MHNAQDVISKFPNAVNYIRSRLRFRQRKCLCTAIENHKSSRCALVRPDVYSKQTTCRCVRSRKLGNSLTHAHGRDGMGIHSVHKCRTASIGCVRLWHGIGARITILMYVIHICRGQHRNAINLHLQ